MKYYKIYSKACTIPHPVQDVTCKKDEVLADAIQWQYDDLFDSGCTVRWATDAMKDLFKLTLDDDVDESIFNKLYELVADYFTTRFEECGSISAGDWGLVALEDGEDAWERRPSRW